MISKGCNYGLISPNGNGKTSLLNFILEKIKLKDCNIHMVQQENNTSEKSVIQELLSSHEKYQNYINQENKLNDLLQTLEEEDQILNTNEELNKLNEWAVSNGINTTESKAR